MRSILYVVVSGIHPACLPAYATCADVIHRVRERPVPWWSRWRRASWTMIRSSPNIWMIGSSVPNRLTRRVILLQHALPSGLASEVISDVRNLEQAPPAPARFLDGVAQTGASRVIRRTAAAVRDLEDASVTAMELELGLTAGSGGASVPSPGSPSVAAASSGAELSLLPRGLSGSARHSRSWRLYLALRRTARPAGNTWKSFKRQFARRRTGSRPAPAAMSCEVSPVPAGLRRTSTPYRPGRRDGRRRSGPSPSFRPERPGALPDKRRGDPGTSTFMERNPRAARATPEDKEE